MRRLLFLPQLARHGDLALLAMRLLAGGFLIHEVWDNIESAARMAEFRGFLAANRFPLPELLAPLSVYLQFAIGAALIAGLFARWAGVALALHFAVAVMMVHATQSVREIWPAAVLVAVGLVFATIGPGRFALDRMFSR